jgi:hypothetical protein
MDRFELNSEGVKSLLQSQEMMEICKGYANNAQARLGDGYEVSTHKGKTRVNAQISAETYKARKDNAKNNTILKAIRG